MVSLSRIKGGDIVDFLNKLYSNEYFGIGLFVVISLLAFSFLVILFFGKKDEKARTKQKDESSIEEQDKTEELSSTRLETISLENEQPKEMEMEEEKISTFESPETDSEHLETFEEKKEEDFDPFVTSNLVLNTDYINDENSDNKDETHEEETFSFDSPKIEEEENIDDVLSKYSTMDETSIFLEDEEATPVINEEEPNDIFSEKEVEAKPSAPFSSVFIEKDKKENKEQDSINVELTKPLFDLPKKMDLPKSKENRNKDNIISYMNDDEEK